MINYQLLTEKEINKFSDTGIVPSLLLHSCCAPCSTYVLEYLSEYFDITVFYYNPNIYPESEFEKRIIELKKLTEMMNFKHPVKFVGCEYESEKFYERVKGLESVPEGGSRCRECFRLRLEKTAMYARENNYDYFTTTLTISPLKNAQVLNELGIEIGEKYGVSYLFSDFKKKNGYKRSCELSKQFELYRQDYCGCIFSMREKNK